eukprot:TRINITY_DN123885_c0_g1_i1.p1 TRINITY_DN123885_c0_g1~~TRINITY_DN123885_c0_g1_i1.p1  ORF type:complete len:410 (+),score=67.90 TRINITY_DN123885_c0_g1_i1:67-1296(+)
MSSSRSSPGLCRFVSSLCRFGRTRRPLRSLEADDFDCDEKTLPVDVPGFESQPGAAEASSLPARISSPRSLQARAGSAECVSASVAASTVRPKFQSASRQQRDTEYEAAQMECEGQASNTNQQPSVSRESPQPTTIGAQSKQLNTPEAESAGTPVLHLAAQYPSAGPVRALLKAGADVHEKDDNGVTALHIAALCGRAEAAKALLEAGASPATVAIDGSAPLHVAARSGSNAVICLLLDAKANLNAADAVGGTALHCAAGAGHHTACELLLECGADCHTLDAWRRSSLHAAAYGGSADAVQTLLLHGSDPGAKDVLGDTPLDMANQYGHANAAMQLSKARPLRRVQPASSAVSTSPSTPDGPLGEEPEKVSATTRAKMLALAADGSEASDTSSESECIDDSDEDSESEC